MAREFINTSLYNDANLVAYYKLEDTTDTKGGFNFTNNGTVTFPAGVFNNCASLGTSNTTKYLSVANNLGINGGNATISGWFKILTAPATNATYMLAMQINDTSDVGYSIKYRDSGGTKQIMFDRLREGIQEDSVVVNQTLTTDTWYHLVVTYDGTNVIGYVNGSAVGSPVASSGNGSGTTANTFRLGLHYNGSSWFASAAIDDVAVLSRALTASEVKSIYTSRTFQKDTNNSLNVGLVSYYKLGDTTDFYGSNNATNVGTSTFTSGKYNNALTLNGSSQYLSVANGMFPWGTNNWSVSLWFKRSSGTDICMFGSHDGTGAGGLEISYGASSGSGKLGVSKIGAAGTQATYTWTADTNWHHLVATQSSTAGLILYLDGSAVNTQAANTSNVINSNKAIGIGARVIGTTPADAFFPGQIDEVGIWSKALSTTEISDLYNSGNGQTMNPPIEFDAKSDGGIVNPGTSLTFSHTVGTGDNRALLVFDFNDTASNVVTGATYNGVAMTSVSNSFQISGDRYVNCFYLLAPDTGTHNVVISASASKIIAGASVSYFGVKQSGQPDSYATGSNPGQTSFSLATTTVADNAWCVLLTRTGGENNTAGTGTVERVDSANGYGIFDSGAPVSPAGSKTLSTSEASATPYGGWNVSFAPYVAPTTNIKSINGLAYNSIKSINGTLIASVKNVGGLT
jgi:hypothetical protein